MLLIGTWVVSFEWIALNVDALLVPWWGSPSWETLPRLGSLTRTINDCFGGPPGAYLPYLAFVLTSGGIFVARSRRQSNTLRLPLVFSLTNALFLAVDLAITWLSWVISDGLVPRQAVSVDAGYHRTWVGILLQPCGGWYSSWSNLRQAVLGRGGAFADDEEPRERRILHC